MNTPQNDGGAVYPHEAVKWDDAGLYVKDNSNYHPGITLRDWFAGQALAENMRATSKYQMSYREWAAIIARDSYAVADAMLAIRNEKQNS